MSKNKVLVIYAHPSQHRSEVNAPLFAAAQAVDGVTCVDLYAEYPQFDINIDKEQARLLEHDVIVFQFPLYWYSTPALLKEWQDLVLEYGFAYGTDGTALQDKLMLCVVSAGGKEEAYKAEGYNHFTIRQLLAPIEQMAALTSMHYLPPFAIFGARTALEENRIDQHVERYVTLLQALVEDRVNIHAANHLNKITHALPQIIKEA
ncbi:flavodoxin family protein [Vibrio vulnificus]|jgi:glutathione-regulated potassium-efflux system ancillary protein KefG|uniref:NAD(P)H-dependent oxidoreductase n=1 Tax=Vibrio vulnificus TaxID=672 RepID=A0AAW4HCH4_VIBVL|nr:MULTISPECIES: NAD(P)H-dependent oxidoreductase [Vibrio]ASC57778.1 Glutathione-regulated potassium-efflux system ancillary protein KefG [Vibrio vulnificus]AUL96374.1 Glutathione-regulated potassium-efflux system ancillary protein KefG [Vibrio vulnificus]AVW98476.1 potassium transporter KefG [Vibrio vulnificus Env1]EGQ7693334.1 flavodoxin family protein [Vibrio vulnificus]EGQ7757011.1 flavodoxin family protein [Vibrio vulnificus]